MNPWSTINTNKPKIIDFSYNGEIIEKSIPMGKIKQLNPKPVQRSGNDIETYFKYIENLKNESHVFYGIRDFITFNSQTPAPRERQKFLTHCKKGTSLCRFLTCADIRKYCILCEVNKANEIGNTTKCEKISTKHLFGHRKRIPLL